MAEVPTIRLEHLSEQQAKAFIIADNRLTEKADWDKQLLGAQLKILSEAEIDFSQDVTGFEVGEIDLFLENAAPSNNGNDNPADAIPEDSGKTRVSRTGDHWSLDRHRELSDYSVCTTWGVRDKHLYLLNVCRKRIGYPELKRAVRELSDTFGPETILIEDKASGTKLIPGSVKKLGSTDRKTEPS
jgi:hypothetical protein